MTEYGPNEKYYKNTSFAFTSWVPEEFFENNNIILDQHSHTLYSDGVLTVEQNVLWHIAHGFNACIITDHDTLKQKTEVQQIAGQYSDQIIVMYAMEWTTWRIHMNFLGIESWNLPIPDNPSDTDIQNAINEAHNQNAVVVVNHIPWSLGRGMNHPTRQQLLDWGVDYIEVINEADYDTESFDNWCNNTGGFGVISGTDMHRPDRVWGWTGLNVTEFSTEAVMVELRNRRTAIYYNSTGAPDSSVAYDNIWYNLTKPMKLIGDLFENYWDNGLDWLGVSIFAGYMIAVFVISEFLRVANRKFWERQNKKRELNK